MIMKLQILPSTLACGLVVGIFGGCSGDGSETPAPGDSGGSATSGTGGDTFVDSSGGSAVVGGSGGHPSSAGGGSGSDGSGATSSTGGKSASGGGENLPGYYVAPDGDDANPGTIDAPFLTLEKARDVVDVENDDMTDDLHVYLREGIHRVSTTISFDSGDSGTNGHRVYYEAYPGETPVLSGSSPVTGWIPHTGGIYKAQLERTTKLRNLYVNDRRALMTSKRVTSQGGSGTYSVTKGQHDWAWTGGSASDGIKYSGSDVPAIASNKDDLEIVNGTTWNENIVCTRDVTTAVDGSRVLLLQQPYGAIAQQPGWNSGFSPSGSHTIYNAFEFLNQAGQFYFDKAEQTLYYYPRDGEDMQSAVVEAPFVDTLVKIEGTSTSDRVKNITFRGIVFENTDYNLYKVDDSYGKASVQAATVFTAFLSGGDWHSTEYEVLDTFPGMIMMNNADSIEVIESVIKHSGSEGISMINDVVNSTLVGNLITDIAGSGITVGHPQHVYIGDGGDHEKYTKAEEGACTDISITNNLLYDISKQPGFGGHSGVTAFYPDGVKIEHNQIQLTAYNGVSLGWGWKNFKDSTTCRDSSVSYNRFIDTLSRLHDSGAVYTIGQMPGTIINENYVRGIPPATSGPTYGLHNDEGTAYIVENDNVLDIDPAVKYTINCEDFGDKHDLTIRRTYATVNKMGVNPPASMIDLPVVVADNVWPLAQYTTCVGSGISDDYSGIIPASLTALVDQALPASVAVSGQGIVIPIRASSDNFSYWFAPGGTSNFVEGNKMTQANGAATSIHSPKDPGTYKLFLLDEQGQKLGESKMILRVQ